MIKISTRLEDKDIIAGVHAQGRDETKQFAIQLLNTHPDITLLEEMVDALLVELERRAALR